MSDDRLTELAHIAGVAPAWKDVFGHTHLVAPPTLRAVLAALGFPAGTPGDITESLGRLQAAAPLPPLITADEGEAITVPVGAARYRLELEDGRLFEGVSHAAGGASSIPAILEPGYHTLHVGRGTTCVAVAPRQCFTAPEALGCAKGWGLAVQLYSLRRSGDAGLGDLDALAQLAAPAARHGAQALAISPLHAQFSADLDRFSPYAPSSRTALNVLHAAIDTANDRLSGNDFVDWPAASRYRLAALRRMFASVRMNTDQVTALHAFRRLHGARLEEHAIFEALHGHFFSADPALWHWRSWPEQFQNKDSAAVNQFTAEHADEISFHVWLQFIADSGLAQAQAACRAAGMGIGLISDLAVGTDSGGSQCWSRQTETLLGLTVGAPPDLLQRDGQNWGLTAFSPTGLVESGFATYRDMLHTALAHAGGMRIDHAMGLNRLWVIPEGATGAEGAYLSFPEHDLLRLIKLESHRNRAIVLAEDLGTIPEGFQDRLREAGIEGMRVLWFERDRTQCFVQPRHWTARAAAMTSTHDLPTLAGWWMERDIDWHEKLGHVTDTAALRAERSQDRSALWSAVCQSGAAAGAEPDRRAPAVFVEAACAHVGRSACELVMLPMEDALGLVEQPNLPGTVHEHPNWQRRLPEDVTTLLDGDATTQRLAALNKARQM